MKTAWVLSGGGAAGSLQVGMMRALTEYGLKPDKVFGTSAGALNTKLYCEQGMQRCLDVWESISGEHDIFQLVLKDLLPFFVDGFYSSAPLRKLLAKHAGTPQIPYDVTAYNLTTQTAHYIPHTDPDILDFTCASASIPVYAQPVQLHGSIYVDGGTTDNVPLKRAIDEGFDRIVVMMCFPEPKPASDGWKPKNFISVAVRAFDGIRADQLRADLQTCRKVSEQVNSTLDDVHRAIDLRVIAPATDSIGVLDFSRENIRTGMDEGYLLGKQVAYLMTQPAATASATPAVLPGGSQQSS